MSGAVPGSCEMGIPDNPSVFPAFFPLMESRSNESISQNQRGPTRFANKC